MENYFYSQTQVPIFLGHGRKNEGKEEELLLHHSLMRDGWCAPPAHDLPVALRLLLHYKDQ